MIKFVNVLIILMSTIGVLFAMFLNNKKKVGTLSTKYSVIIRNGVWNIRSIFYLEMKMMILKSS